MKLITFGLGGAKAIFLRLGFGSSAQASEQPQVGGGLLSGQFRPAILRPPILLDLRIQPRLRIGITGRAQVTKRRSAVSFGALPQPSGRGLTANHAIAAGRLVVGIAGRGAITRGAVWRSDGSARIAVRASVNVVRRAGSALRIGIAGGASTTNMRMQRSRFPLQIRGQAQVQRAARLAQMTRAQLGVRGRARTDFTTLVSRIDTADRHDLRSISFV